MAGAAPREGTFTRDLRINPSTTVPSGDEAAVVRSPTHHPSSVGPGASPFAETVPLAHARQRREAQLASQRSPTATFGSPPGVPLCTSPSHAYSRSPSFGSDRTTSKSPLSPTSRRRSRSIFAPSNLRTTLGLLAGGMMLLFFLCSLYSSVNAAKIPESQPALACEAHYDTLKPHAHPLHHSVHEGEHGDFPLHSARASIAIVTMADTRNVPLPKNLAYLSDIKPGSLVNILDVVWRNRQEYADRHGYTLINGTELVGKDRPPSWYKLKVCTSAYFYSTYQCNLLSTVIDSVFSVPAVALLQLPTAATHFCAHTLGHDVHASAVPYLSEPTPMNLLDCFSITLGSLPCQYMP